MKINYDEQHAFKRQFRVWTSTSEKTQYRYSKSTSGGAQATKLNGDTARVFVTCGTGDLDSFHPAEHFHCLALFVTPMGRSSNLYSRFYLFFPANAFIASLWNPILPFPVCFRRLTLLSENKIPAAGLRGKSPPIPLIIANDRGNGPFAYWITHDHYRFFPCSRKCAPVSENKRRLIGAGELKPFRRKNEDSFHCERKLQRYSDRKFVPQSPQ